MTIWEGLDEDSSSRPLPFCPDPETRHRHLSIHGSPHVYLAVTSHLQTQLRARHDPKLLPLNPRMNKRERSEGRVAFRLLAVGYMLNALKRFSRAPQI